MSMFIGTKRSSLEQRFSVKALLLSVADALLDQQKITDFFYVYQGESQFIVDSTRKSFSIQLPQQPLIRMPFVVEPHLNLHLKTQSNPIRQKAVCRRETAPSRLTGDVWLTRFLINSLGSRTLLIFLLLFLFHNPCKRIIPSSFSLSPWNAWLDFQFKIIINPLLLI